MTENVFNLTISSTRVTWSNGDSHTLLVTVNFVAHPVDSRWHYLVKVEYVWTDSQRFSS